jgi:U3 small nucleolar RNA-associated protein 6
MADTVQILMEKMIPELEDLQQKKLFIPEEIRQIVQKRRDFEYMMKRIPMQKVDALRYIEYEANLEALRQKRKERSGMVNLVASFEKDTIRELTILCAFDFVGLKKTSVSDFAGVRRIHSIFDRLLYKHRGSIDLWLQYINFCKNDGSEKILSKVFSRALQVHPRSEEIWIEAASHEFSANLNVESARGKNENG